MSQNKDFDHIFFFLIITKDFQEVFPTFTQGYRIDCYKDY